MYDFDNNQDLNLQRIINFYSLLLNLHSFPYDYSPDYILEKWEKWIGDDCWLSVNGALDISLFVKFEDFKKKWGEHPYIYSKIEGIFYFLCSNENMNMRNNMRDFKHFGGDLRKICALKKTGLHFMVYNNMIDYLKLNTENIKGFLRDMIIDDLMEEES